jgi:hypothetical protein
VVVAVTVDAPHLTKTATVGQIEMTWVSVPNAVALRAEVAVAAIAYDPPSLRRSAGIGLLLSSVGIKVGMSKSFQEKWATKIPVKGITGTFVNYNSCQTGKNA